MSHRAKNWLIFGIIVAVFAGTIGVVKLIHFQKYKIPDDAVLGNLDVTLVQSEPDIIISIYSDETAESTTIYIFRPDGGLNIGSFNEAIDDALYPEVTEGFSMNEPGSVYFIKDDKVYCCSAINRNWEITDRKTWQAFAIFELRDGIPYIDDNYIVYNNVYPIALSENRLTWNDFIAQVNEKIAEYESSR
ncbi:MAG TPA: hypothetical protein PK629_06940 [Oscillospiraceae bacterium]|nr:hypothetical protein [Oscillospiraceae bacterium]HPF55282.1 hypothetical protein [Clostridiales bacterium]HPK34686.1 hypothetical protein [Oscillospiraceae bacterium]HPR74550.1 hypothetical protein [Oscillospiraceae bacterium]